MRVHSKAKLLRAILDASIQLGKSFRASDFQKHTGIDRDAVSRKFGSWHDAMIAAGLQPVSSRRSILKSDLLMQAKNLANQLGKDSLTITDWRGRNLCDDGTIRRRFGSWSRFLQEAGLRVGTHRDIPNEALLSELDRLFRLLGKNVSSIDMNSMGKYSSSVYIKRWGSWSAAWACYQDNPQLIRDTSEAASPPIFANAGRFGDIVNIPGLLHAPVNELGVVYLFALASKRLGFVLEAIQASFPDAVAKRKLPGQNTYEQVRIEFEFKSSSFRSHGHDPKGCDLIVCWEHDWKESPVPVLELRRMIKDLKNMEKG